MDTRHGNEGRSHYKGNLFNGRINHEFRLLKLIRLSFVSHRLLFIRPGFTSFLTSN